MRNISRSFWLYFEPQDKHAHAVPAGAAVLEAAELHSASLA